MRVDIHHHHPSERLSREDRDLFLAAFGEISASLTTIKDMLMALQDDANKAAADFAAYVESVNAFIDTANKVLADNAAATAAAVAQAKADAAAAGDADADAIVNNLDTAIQAANSSAQSALASIAPPPAPPAPPAPAPAPTPAPTDTTGGASTSTTTAVTITITPATLSGANIGDAVDVQLQASGGTAPYSYAVTSGQLPHGLAITGGSGSDAGTITGSYTEAGHYLFTITATDANGATGSVDYDVQVATPSA